MFVCLCNGYRDKELREMAQEGVRDVDDAYERLGGGPKCRRCVTFAQDILNREAGEVEPAPLFGAEKGLAPA